MFLSSLVSHVADCTRRFEVWTRKSQKSSVCDTDGHLGSPTDSTRWQEERAKRQSKPESRAVADAGSRAIHADFALSSLQVRIRYQNPLPPPPFPPKLLQIPTDLNRFASYDTLRPIEAEREMPLLVDAELGMYLENGQGDPDYWEGDRSRVAPGMVEIPLDEDDLDLLGEAAVPNSAGAPGLLGAPTGTPQAAKKSNGVAWLRRTEYLSTMDQGTPQRFREADRYRRLFVLIYTLLSVTADRSKPNLRTFRAKKGFKLFSRLSNQQMPLSKASLILQFLREEQPKHIQYFQTKTSGLIHTNWFDIRITLPRNIDMFNSRK